MYHSVVQLLTAAKLIARATGATVSELTERLGIDRRSVYRVLGALDELGYPYLKDTERGNRFRLVEPEQSLKWWAPGPVVTFDLEDRVLLDWLFESADRDPALAPTLRSLRKKLAYLGVSAGYALAFKSDGAGPESRKPRLLASSKTGKKAVPEAEGILRTLLAAVEGRLVCDVSYESRESGEVRTYPIHPLALFEDDGGLYCFVEIAKHGSIRILALERIRELSTRTETFKPPADFNARERLSDPFGIVQGDLVSVRVVFSQDQGAYVRDRAWPESYVFEDLPDGRLSLTFRTRGIFGLKRWILGWGADAEVMEPDWLRREIAEEIGRMGGAYE